MVYNCGRKTKTREGFLIGENMVEVLERQRVNISNTMGDLPTSEEQTGYMSDDGLPPLVVGCGYRLVMRCPEDPDKTTKSGVVVYSGFNDEEAMVFKTQDNGCLYFRKPELVAGQIRIGAFEIIPTGKTIRRLKK